MNGLSSTAAKMLLLPLLVGSLHAASLKIRLVAQTNSFVTIEGTSNLHDWKVKGQQIGGFVECAPSFPAKEDAAVFLGEFQATMTGSVPVRSLHFDGADKVLDPILNELLKDQMYPLIHFHFSKLIARTLANPKGASCLFDSRAELVVAGVTNQISMPLSVVPLGGKKMKITGSASLKLSDFGIHPSLPDGWIKVGDEVKIDFEWFVGPTVEAKPSAPEASEKN